jgi:hypothetical protein
MQPDRLELKRRLAAKKHEVASKVSDVLTEFLLSAGVERI